MDINAMISQQLDLSHERVKRCVADLTDEEARRVLAGMLTPVIWQLGHLAVVDAGVVQRGGGSYTVPPRYVDLFKQGTGGQADYPPLEEVSATFDGAQWALLTVAREADYTKPVEARAYTNVGEMLIFVNQHRGYHIGKMTTLRALLTKPRLFG